MSRGNRSVRSSALGLICTLILLLSIAIAWTLGSLQGSESERRQQTPASYSQAAKTEAQHSCAGREAGALFECVYEKVEAAQEQARGEQDLSAQQRAASSALAAAIIAFFTLATTLVALWLLKGTLDATREAVKDTSLATDAMLKANEISQKGYIAQNRAWAIIEDFRVAEVRRTGNKIHVVTHCYVRNTGPTPATKFFFFTQVHNAYDNDKNLIGYLKEALEVRRGTGGNGALGPRERTDFGRGRQLDVSNIEDLTKVCLKVFVGAVYHTMDDTERLSVKEVVISGPGNAGFDLSLDGARYTASDFVVVTTLMN